MSVSGNGLVQKLWSYCNVLRDDGLSYQDYLEQLTFLLFLKMADELTGEPWRREPFIPEGLDWQSLLALDGEELEAQYIRVLRELSGVRSRPMISSGQGKRRPRRSRRASAEASP